MGSLNKAGITYLILVVVMYGGVLLFAATIADTFDEEAEARKRQAVEEYFKAALPEQYDSILRNIHEVKIIETKETFHDYLIIGGTRVIHKANCKCKTPKNGRK